MMKVRLIGSFWMMLAIGTYAQAPDGMPEQQSPMGPPPGEFLNHLPPNHFGQPFYHGLTEGSSR